jgi:hypothetical protein
MGERFSKGGIDNPMGLSKEGDNCMNPMNRGATKGGLRASVKVDDGDVYMQSRTSRSYYVNGEKGNRFSEGGIDNPMRLSETRSPMQGVSEDKAGEYLILKANPTCKI